MSIATTTGDKGTTGLAGGGRISKADLRVEALGAVDELNAFLGFARSHCTHPDIAGHTEEIQRTLFQVGASLATLPASRRREPVLTEDHVHTLTILVHLIEATPGILADWSLPGANRESAAFELARVTCRRAERLAVALDNTSVTPEGAPVPPGDPARFVLPAVLGYLNRLSDLIWLFGRLIEVRAGQDTRLREDANAGPGFSRAW